MDNQVFLEDVKKRWDTFKKKRSYNTSFNPDDPHFISMLEREQIIDLLFDYIKSQEDYMKEYQ
jgi:hypothetical protein